MKKIFLPFLLIGACLSAQTRFDCNNISPDAAKSRYYSIKNLGMDYKFPKGQDVVPSVIDMLGYSGLRQVCIDAAYKNHLQGTEQQYNYYINNIKYISKEDFYRNYDYLMIFDEVVNAIEKNTNYRRQR